MESDACTALIETPDNKYLVQNKPDMNFEITMLADNTVFRRMCYL